MNTPENFCARHADVAGTTALASEGPPRASVVCTTCDDVWKQVEALRHLGQQLAGDDPESERVSRVRRAVIESLQKDRGDLRQPVPRRQAKTRRRWIWGAMTSASAAAMATVLVVQEAHRAPSVPNGASSAAASLATIEAQGPAHFSQVQVPPDEEVHVTFGKVHVAVVHLDPGQRFRITTADATVEVRGTEFNVEVANDHLCSVDVSRGKVEVRTVEHDAVTLTPGLHWEAQPTTPGQGAPQTAHLPAVPIGLAAESQSSRPVQRHAGPVRPRNPSPSTPAPPPFDRPSPLGVAQATASVVTADPRVVRESSPVPAPPPTIPAPAAARPASVAEEKQSRKDERIDRREERREERLERLRELRQERLERHR